MIVSGDFKTRDLKPQSAGVYELRTPTQWGKHPWPYIVMVSQISHDHDDLIKWKHFPRYWPFVRGIHRSPVNSPHKSQWRGALMFSLLYARINGWVNTGRTGDLRSYCAHYDVTVMCLRAMLPGRLFKHPGNLYDTTTWHKDNISFENLTRGPTFQFKTERIVLKCI